MHSEGSGVVRWAKEPAALQAGNVREGTRCTMGWCAMGRCANDQAGAGASPRAAEGRGRPTGDVLVSVLHRRPSTYTTVRVQVVAANGTHRQQVRQAAVGYTPLGVCIALAIWGQYPPRTASC